jgi:predicted ATPase
VPLAPLRDPNLVLESAGQALGATDGIAEHVSDKSLLLLLDNFEQVVEAADGLSGLLAACPNLKLLVTSRELLRIPAEQAYPVPPLEPEDGAELFLARAHAVDPAFASSTGVVELCARLEQLPLALELAAARIRVLSPEQLLERLSGRLDLLKAGRGTDPRQQTLRATIEWSYELLGEEEQRLFARLAVFRGGCTLESAEEVCDADLETLQSLVDKSLVRLREGERFWMLESVREFAQERLEASAGTDDLRRRHADHFLALAEEAEPYARKVDPDWLERLDRELENLRAALDWLESAGETQLVLRLAGGLDDFWVAKGHVAEGSRRVEAALAADDSPTAARAKALNTAADLAVGHADVAHARLRAEQALLLHRQFADDWGAAGSLFLLGHAAADDQEYETARALWEESLGLWKKAGDRYYALLASRMLGWAYAELGESDRARSLMEHVLAEARAAGDKHIQVHVLESLAIDAAQEGRVEEAAATFGRHTSSTASSATGTARPIVCRFARVLALAAKTEAAARVLATGEMLYEDMGSSPMAWLKRGTTKH